MHKTSPWAARRVRTTTRDVGEVEAMSFFLEPHPILVTRRNPRIVCM